MLNSALSVGRERANKRQFTFSRAGYCESARSGGKEIANIMFDSFVNQTGWKLILSQNVGKFLDVVVNANPGIIDFKCHVHQRSY